MARYYDLNSLVTTRDIAKIYGVGVPAVSNWKVRHKDFPVPVWRNFYDIKEIDKWYRALGDNK